MLVDRNLRCVRSVLLNRRAETLEIPLALGLMQPSARRSGRAGVGARRAGRGSSSDNDTRVKRTPTHIVRQLYMQQRPAHLLEPAIGDQRQVQSVLLEPAQPNHPA